MSFLTLVVVVVVVVHSTCTSRSIWPMHKTNRTLGILFKWALVVFIVCCVYIFFYVSCFSFNQNWCYTFSGYLPDIQQAEPMARTADVLFTIRAGSKSHQTPQKGMLLQRLCFVRLSWRLHNISQPTTFPTAFVFVTSATGTLMKHEMLGMNRSKGVQEWFTSLAKPSSSAKDPLIYTFMQESKTISECLNLSDTDCSKALQT